MPAAAPHRIRMHGEDRRRQLLKAAIESFAQKGFSGTKTKDIAAAAGDSEAILFRHFASKEDLYHAILDAKESPDAKNQLMQELEHIAARRDDSRFFLQIATAAVRSFKEDPAFHRLLVYASLEGHLMASLFRARFGVPFGNFLKRYVSQRQRDGAFHRCDPDIAVSAFFGSVVHYAMGRYVFETEEPPVSDEVVVKELVALFLRGIKKG